MCPQDWAQITFTEAPEVLVFIYKAQRCVLDVTVSHKC